MATQHVGTPTIPLLKVAAFLRSERASVLQPLLGDDTLAFLYALQQNNAITTESTVEEIIEAVCNAVEMSYWKTQLYIEFISHQADEIDRDAEQKETARLVREDENRGNENVTEVSGAELEAFKSNTKMLHDANAVYFDVIENQ